MAKRTTDDVVVPTPVLDSVEVAAPLEASPVEPAPVGTQLISLDVFITVHPLKADQLAGFRRWVALQHGNAMHSVPEWQQLLSSYFNRPVR